MAEAAMLLNVNGEEHTYRGAADTPLLWVLRDALGLKGTKYGCGVGVCGSCIVLIDDEPRHACTFRVDEVSGKSVVTIEGFARKPEHPVIQAWIAEQVPQCGYCQPAQVLTAAWLLGRYPHPSDAEIDNALSPVLCRCGSYPRIRRAVRRAAEMLARKARRNPCSTAALGALPAAGPGDTEGYVFNPWVRIARDGTITVVIDRSEMGQGAITGLAMLARQPWRQPYHRTSSHIRQTAPRKYDPSKGPATSVGDRLRSFLGVSFPSFPWRTLEKKAVQPS